MRILKVLFVLLISACVAVPALSQCPKPGTYNSFSGDVDEGRSSEAWCSFSGPGVPGNMENAMSWDGAILGGQWHVYGMYIDENGAMETRRVIDENGNGFIEYQTNYDGGRFWMTKDNVWTNGVEDLTGTVSYFTVTTTVTLSGWEVVGQVSNIYFNGVFDNCMSLSFVYLLEFVIANAGLVWRSDWPDPMPPNYPPFSCTGDGTPEPGLSGELFDVCGITLKIHMEFGVEESSWGKIKEMYR